MLIAVTEWPAAVAQIAATAGAAWAAWLAYRESRESRRVMQDSTVLTRSTDTTHADRIKAAAERQEQPDAD